MRVSPAVTRRDTLEYALASTPVLAAGRDGALVYDVDDVPAPDPAPDLAPDLAPDFAPDLGQWDLSR